MSPPSDVGPLVRLWGLRTAQLLPVTASPEELTPFLTSVLKETVPFIDSAAPKDSNGKADSKLWKPKGTKTHKDSTAPIVVSERTIPAAELDEVRASNPDCNAQQVAAGGAEMWACRRSVHEDTDSKPGTASWAEFVTSFIEEHAETEAAFTPEVLAHHEAAVWDGLAKAPAPAIEVGGTSWSDIRLKVTEMRHKMPMPLQHRTFPVLQMSCCAGGEGEQEFLFVSVPVRDFGTASEHAKLSKEKGTQVAYYVSIERVRKIKGSGNEDGKIEWLMATASDAAGVIPAWVNNLAMPGVVWKDVPLFLGWMAKARKGNGKGKESMKEEEQGGDGGEGATATVTTDT